MKFNLVVVKQRYFLLTAKTVLEIFPHEDTAAYSVQEGEASVTPASALDSLTDFLEEMQYGNETDETVGYPLVTVVH